MEVLVILSVLTAKNKPKFGER